MGLLTGSAVLSVIGLYLLSTAHNAMTAFGYATIFGLGIAYFWPTMLGQAAERFPKGGALILALLGSAANTSVAVVLPWIGNKADVFAVAHVVDTDATLGASFLKVDDAGQPIALDAQAVAQLAEGSPEANLAKEAEKVGFREAFPLRL